MASFAIKGSLPGPSFAAFLSGQKPRNISSISSNGNHLARQSSGVVPSMTWSMENEKRHMKLMSLGPKSMRQSGNYPYDGQPLESDTDLSNPFAPGIQIDLLNRMSVRSPLLERTEAVIADQRKRRLRASQQRTRDFVYGLVQYISSHRENYKYFITASKENANMIMEQLEPNVSRLLSCKDKTNSMLLTALPSGNIDDSKNSLFKDSSGQIHNSAIKFGNMIIGDIAYDLSNLERVLASWMGWHLLMPNDILTRNHLLLNKSMLDMDKFTALRSDYSIYVPVEDSGKRFLSVYEIIPEVLKEAINFVKSSSFNHENIQNFPHDSRFVRGRATLRAIKPTLQDQSDGTRRKLLDWLQRLQPARELSL